MLMRTWIVLAVACSSPTAPAGGPDGAASADATVADPREPFEVWRHREPIYELYVRHFSAAGTFKGVEARLPELRALGIVQRGMLVSGAEQPKTFAPGGRPDAVLRKPFDLDDLFREHGLVIAFPQRDVHLDTVAPLEVRILDAAQKRATSEPADE